jgi:plasmid stabilization system protein ParE/GNAT superfamily N-acetyltransferase
MEPWTPERVWDAVDDWRWIPPGAQTVVTDAYVLAVTPGSYSLTYVYGFHAEPPERTDETLELLRRRVEALGGTGARIQLTPRTHPRDLADRLGKHGYRPKEEAEVLVWRLRGADSDPRLPAFCVPAGIRVHEIRTETEYGEFTQVSRTVFGDPPASEESRKGFLAAFHQKLADEGHSERFLATEGGTPIGCAGMELAGPVARFWGTGVLTEHRRRGVYGALVRARSESAAERGAEILLVTARVGTSGPILKRHGFEPMGTIRVFEARW